MKWCSGAAGEKLVLQKKKSERETYRNKEKSLTIQKCPPDSHLIFEIQHTGKHNAKTSTEDTIPSSASI